MAEVDDDQARPFEGFRAALPRRSPLRRAITAATLRPEPDCLPPLIAAATLRPEQAATAKASARKLVGALRAKGAGEGVEGLIQEYALSSEEGVSLMCLAEALLRIPDAATRDALIRDKIGGGDWRKHIGRSPSLFVNAATWGLLVTGRLTSTANETSLSSALMRLIGRGGEPLIRAGVDLAMRMMGEQFVMGRTIEEALERSRKLEGQGFRYSYDMLGEAAMTAVDAKRYFDAYRDAIRAIGRAARGRGLIEGPGISIKLSALHPRYSFAQRDRVLGELLPRLKTLSALARRFDIGLNIDAEESERLELSLDLLEALCLDPEFAGWDGLGFVVQAYGRRAPFVIDWLIDLARRSRRRLMLRLVKGAYWDSEIKRAQVLGLAGFPVFTRKPYTDVSYLACARKMLEAGDAIYPQFATHNAMTLAAIHEMAGPDWPADAYEFQCLHGMGERLYAEVVGAQKLGRPCRIYAPVGTHETLLAYLVRRLLENGANSSFVNRIADEDVAVDELLVDPVEQARALMGAPHPKIVAPCDLYAPSRPNSAGIDLCDESVLSSTADGIEKCSARGWFAAPTVSGLKEDGPRKPIVNPARRDDVVGYVVDASSRTIDAAFRAAEDVSRSWAETAPVERAARLERASDLSEAAAAELYGLIVREAGKTLASAVSEVREAIDFLRYYAAEARGWSNETHRPLGPVVCISPWNFPLAIFTGQIAAALAAGNPVLAKPAEETPLIAAEVVALLRKAGVPEDALQLLPGDGDVGAALVADKRTRGVLFTGSTEAARSIQKSLADRLGPDGRPIPLVAETGGQNAMVVGSSALTEQVVADAIMSAFDSAGQRCSALRVLCVQEDVADHILSMLKGALAELRVGDPERLSTDVGPVISEDARRIVEEHVAEMQSRGFRVTRAPLPNECSSGTFVPPTIIEIDSVAVLSHEVFGPVLHVVRSRNDDLDPLVDDVNATGYALTFGLHTRIDETVQRVMRRAAAGNVYVNRNIIGAVVGVQPFGGHGLSGTGPKAGGPLYLRRLTSRAPIYRPPADGKAPAAALVFSDWLYETGQGDLAACCRGLADRSPLNAALDLPGPAGETNVWSLEPRGAVLCRAADEAGSLLMIGAVLATGNVAVVDGRHAEAIVARLPEALAGHVVGAAGFVGQVSAALVNGNDAALIATQQDMAMLPGPIVPVHALSADDVIPLEWLVRERSVSVNTAAAGGNASLMALEP